jgi:hypothetical protein
MAVDPVDAVKGPHVLIALEAQNLKRLQAVAITFGGAAVAQITGPNEQGKSSLLDAFKFAVGGTKEIQKQPIRRGTDEAIIKLDFGKIVVTKTLRRTDDGGFKPTLVVTTADGVKLPSPQAVLDEWLGPLTFDPLALVRAPGRERADMVKALVPNFDFAAAEAQNSEDYDRRTLIGRDRARERAAAEAITVEPDTPDKLIDIADLQEEYRLAVEHNGRLDSADDLNKRAIELRHQADELDRRASALMELALKHPLGSNRADLEAIKTRGQQVQSVNTQVELKLRKAEHEDAAADADRKYEAITERMEARTQQMADAIAAAKLPVEAMSFSDDDLLVDGLPFDQASSAKQIEVAVALSMAMNPSLRVIRIKDGALLDDAHMKLIETMAAKAGYLILMERVSPSEGVGMVVEIEGGLVKSVKAAPKGKAK